MSTFAYLKMSKPERVKPVAKEKVWQVDVITAQPQTLSPSLTLYGEVETPSLVKAAAPGPGLVAEVLVSPGDRVQQSQKLVSMDSRDFAAANLQAQADVTDIEAQIAEHELRYRANLKSVEEEKNLLELAKKELKRIESLKRNNPALLRDRSLRGSGTPARPPPPVADSARPRGCSGRLSPLPGAPREPGARLPTPLAPATPRCRTRRWLPRCA